MSSDETLPSTSSPAAQAPQTPPPAAPDSRYVLDREIGHGGMGRVFAGRDLRLGRTVAIKILRTSDSEARARFEHEARLAARLQHPGIVTVYDAGFWPTGEPFLVMKLVLGRSFDRVIADAETLKDRLGLLSSIVAVTDALAYAHDQAVVHRDLKPGNIIVGAFGETVVLDWGLAKASGTPAEHGAVVGTPAYMPPEQARGEDVDVRADVYALGALLYHTLAGQLPARDTNAVPSLAMLEPRIHRDVVAIVTKAMRENRDERYPTAYELGEDLKRFLTGQRVAARRYSWLASAAHAIGKRPALAATLLAVAGAIVWHLFRR